MLSLILPTLYDSIHDQQYQPDDQQRGRCGQETDQPHDGCISPQDQKDQTVPDDKYQEEESDDQPVGGLLCIFAQISRTRDLPPAARLVHLDILSQRSRGRGLSRRQKRIA